MHIHILGICGTFMGSMALLARQRGFRVSGVDEGIYPPMSDQLRAADIELYQGYADHGLDQLSPDIVVIGNAMSRGNPAVEYVLDHRIPYVSGPEWLAREVLQGKHVLAVAGTHGKTTTSSMLAWILEYAGLSPGFLIGGVPENFGISARLGEKAANDSYFVIEADEYDTAFFDKRSKFIHYRPQTLVLNNLEFDHADIFPDLAAIQRQFHHLVRTVPRNGCILMPDEPALQQVIEQGLWSAQELLSGESSRWVVAEVNADQSSFVVNYEGEGPLQSAAVDWALCGAHNLSNAIAAMAASQKIGISLAVAAEALCQFVNVKRRLELLGEVAGIRVYDDFAHHPTAIETTLKALREKHRDGRIIAVIEPRSNTMKMGVHNARLPDALSYADQVFWFAGANRPSFEQAELLFDQTPQVRVVAETPLLVDQLVRYAEPGDSVIVMSNGGFEGIHRRILASLQSAGQ